MAMIVPKISAKLGIILIQFDINMNIIQSTITDNNGDFSFGLIDNSNLVIANSILWNENASYEFTTLTCVPGVIEYKVTSHHTCDRMTHHTTTTITHTGAQF